MREIDGIPPGLLKAFSSRRAEIEGGYQAALEAYRAAHGHDPPRHVQYRLAQEATLANRPAKDHPRSWAQARQDWLTQAAKVLRGSPFGSGPDVETMVRDVLARGIPSPEPGSPEPGTTGGIEVADRPGAAGAAGISGLARRVVEVVAEARSTWTRWHVQAEAHRLTRGLAVAPDQRDGLVEAVTAAALSSHSLRIGAPDLNPTPEPLQRGDGEGVYTVHGTTRYTSEPLVLAVEDRLLAANQTHTGRATDEAVLGVARARLEGSHDWVFDPAQVDLARSFACDDRRLVAGVGPAGTGKTTAMRLTAAALGLDGRRLVAVAPSARAAAVLGQEIGVPATTIAKLLHTHQHAASTGDPVPPGWVLHAGDVVLVDEAGMAGTPTLGRLLTLAEGHGALVRLLGDPMQLTAVEAGGALRLLAQSGGAVELDRVHRFADPAEAGATLRLRGGYVSALGFYETRDRSADGSREEMTDRVYAGWSADLAAGRVSLMVSASTAEVAALSARARRDRVAAGAVEAGGVALHDGNLAGVGDLVVTRANQRALTVCGGRDFVKNGDLWTVTGRHEGADLSVRHQGHGGTVRLPAGYVAGQVELGYATTVHRAQGMTVETGHVLVDHTMSREALYVGLSRGRACNRAYVVTGEALDVDLHVPPGPRSDALDVLRGVLARESCEHSATETITDTLQAAESLATLVPAYLDGYARAVLTDDLDAAVRAGLRDAGRDPAGNLAAVLAWRVARLSQVEGGDRRRDPSGQSCGTSIREPLGPPWLPAPTPAMAQDPVGRWATGQEQLIAARVQALVDGVAVDPPAWAAALAPRPEPGPLRDRWDCDVGVVVAYRDQYQVTDDTDPLGTARVHGHQQNTRLTARAAWRRVAPTAAGTGAGADVPQSANDRLRALALRGRQRPAAAGDALRRLKNARRSLAAEAPYEPARHRASERGPRW